MTLFKEISLQSLGFFYKRPWHVVLMLFAVGLLLNLPYEFSLTDLKLGIIWLLLAFISLLAVLNFTIRSVVQLQQHTNQLSPFHINWRLPLFMLALIFWLVMVYYLSGYVVLYTVYLTSVITANLLPMNAILFMLWFTSLFYLFTRFGLVIPAAAVGHNYSFTSAWLDSSNGHIQFTLCLAAVPLLNYWLISEFFHSEQFEITLIRQLLISITAIYTIICLSYIWLHSNQTQNQIIEYFNRS